MDDFDFLEDDVFGKVTELPKGQRSEFTAWHRPRKQWVRSCQWKNSLISLARKREYQNVEELNYFGFPGADCLDVRVLGKALYGENKKLCYYGLETKEENAVRAQAVTESLLHDTPYISEKSRIEASSQFELLKATNSKLTAEVIAREPFNIINLDFVDSVLTGPDTMPALSNLLRYQFERQYLPWMLFLTTRYDLQANPIESLQNYVGVLEANLNEHPEFNSSVNTEVFGVDPSTTWDQTALLEQDGCFESVFLLSFLKWILKNAHSNNIRMRLHPIADYKVRELNEKNDMCSLVIEFIKVNQPNDATGVIQAISILESELNFALRIVSRVTGIKDVDALLNEEPELFDRMKSEMVSLLDDCGYVIDRYPF